MTELFDKNGNATETHVVTVSGFSPATGEFESTYDVRILAGTGIPRYSTLTLAPAPDEGSTACWDGSAWVQVEDLRGKTAYKKSDRSSETVRSLGPLDDAYTLLAPETPFDKWNGSDWVTDTDAQHAADVAAAELTKQNLLAYARETISIWQTELQLGSISEEDKNQLIAWLAYIKEVQAVDTSNAPTINWPEQPYA